MILKKVGGLLGLVVLGVACSEISPTGVDPDLLPEAPVTAEVRIPWDQFGSNFATYGGFGSTSALGVGIVAHQMGDSLESRMLVRLNGLPTSVTIRDTTGTSRTDTLLRVTGGRLIAVLDTVGSVADGPVTLETAMIHQDWEASTATWTSAFDSLLGSRIPWEEEGAGPVTNPLTSVWHRADGDSIIFRLDSAGVATWSDTASSNQGMRIASLTPGTRLKILNVLMQVDVRPSSNPDTTVVLVAGRGATTFIYTPEPPPPAGALRVGGTPSWRSVMSVTPPASLSGPPAVCAVLGCPLPLTAGRVSYAALVLTTRSVVGAFAPSDTVDLDVRPVFDAAALPKAPLGVSLLTNSVGRRVAASFFGSEAGREVEIPITSFVRSLLDPDTAAVLPPPSTLALLSTFEPVSIAYADFFGPGSVYGPVLKLIVTVGSAVELP